MIWRAGLVPVGRVPHRIRVVVTAITVLRGETGRMVAQRRHVVVVRIRDRHAHRRGAHAVHAAL